MTSIQRRQHDEKIRHLAAIVTAEMRDEMRDMGADGSDASWSAFSLGYEVGYRECEEGVQLPEVYPEASPPKPDLL